MKEQIQQLIANNQTEDALRLLQQTHADDALLLLAQYNNGKKQFNLGLIEFSEWQRIQARVNFAALELAGTAGRVAVGAVPEPGNPAPEIEARRPNLPAPEPSRPKVFISYSRQDDFAMRSVMQYLERNGMNVIVDIKDVAPGQEIQSFIDDALRNNDFVLSIISKNSLSSGWVNVELSAARVLNRIQRNWIPVRIDNSLFDDEFYNDLLRSLDVQIQGTRDKIRQAIDTNVSPAPFTDQLSRLENARAQLGLTIQQLRNINVVNISDGHFDTALNAVIARINQV